LGAVDDSSEDYLGELECECSAIKIGDVFCECASSVRDSGEDYFGEFECPAPGLGDVFCECTRLALDRAIAVSYD
jgi:hypothetical protein